MSNLNSCRSVAKDLGGSQLSAGGEKSCATLSARHFLSEGCRTNWSCRLKNVSIANKAYSCSHRCLLVINSYCSIILSRELSSSESQIWAASSPLRVL